KTLLQPLTDGKNVSFSVLEPRRFRATTGCDTVDGLDPRHVVFFKRDASRFKCGDLGRNISHRPKRRTGPRRAGASRWIHEYPRSLATFVDDTAGVLLLRLQADLLLVELSRPGYNLHGNVWNYWSVAQHAASSLMVSLMGSLPCLVASLVRFLQPCGETQAQGKTTYRHRDEHHVGRERSDRSSDPLWTAPRCPPIGTPYAIAGSSIMASARWCRWSGWRVSSPARCRRVSRRQSAIIRLSEVTGTGRRGLRQRDS